MRRVIAGAFGSESPAETARLTELLYGELRKLAGSYLRRENVGHTLQPTALVHEAFLRLSSQRHEWKDKKHFLAIAAQTMRRVLVDHARRRGALKRGGLPITITIPTSGSDTRALDLLELDGALERLHARDARASRIVELHIFGGLEISEVADVVGVSLATAKRDWSFARAWLKRELGGDAA